jgi:sugar lactone lactonase YvrE
MVKYVLNIGLIFFISIFFISCSATKQESVSKGFIIPDPPQEPRIMHIKTYRGESDLVKKSGLDTFLGGDSAFASKDFRKPFGVTAKDGKFYVSDTGMAIVYVIDTVNKTVSFIGDKSKGKLALPVGVAIDENDNVYVSDSKLQRVYGYDKQGNAFFVLGNDEDFIRPTGIAINQKLQIIYVVDTKGHTVRAYSLNGDHLFDIGERGNTDGTFNFPTSIAVDQNSGNVVVVDTQNFRIQIFDQEGNFLHTFGNVGDKPGTFSRPKGVAIDSESNIYVSDAAFDNIQIFDKTGTQLMLYFGSAGYDPGQFQIPTGLFIDGNDRIYVVENFSGKVQVLQYLSQQWKQKNPQEYKELMDMREEMLEE